jgi:DNA-binding CsgD family transcriptional regulator/bifunctional DNA-binding transcriptional regulator/antitoxin component of YhaV-PrlF toxin-antitoxin module
MPTNRFRISIGAKRQVTLPAELLEQLQIPERGELHVEVIGGHAVVTPMVSVPRSQLPEELRRTFESRRGANPSDIPLPQFLKDVGYEPPPEKAGAAPHLFSQEHPVNLTNNEMQTVQQFLEQALQVGPVSPMPALTEREKQVLGQLTRSRSPRQIAHALRLKEHTVRSYLSSIERKLARARVTPQDEALSSDG